MENTGKHEIEQEELAQAEVASDVAEEADKEDNSKNGEAASTSEENIPEEIDYQSKYLYLAAEMDNMKKRFQRDKEKLIKFGNEELLRRLIDTLDNFERTLEAIKSSTEENGEDEKTKNIILGIQMVQKQFISALSDFGLKAVEALGKIFDPNFHEAIAKEESEDKEEHEVIKEFQKGYTLNGRLLRATKVVVAKKKEGE